MAKTSKAEFFLTKQNPSLNDDLMGVIYGGTRGDSASLGKGGRKSFPSRFPPSIRTLKVQPLYLDENTWAWPVNKR